MRLKSFKLNISSCKRDPHLIRVAKTKNNIARCVIQTLNTYISKKMM